MLANPELLKLEDLEELQFALARVDAMEEARWANKKIRVLCLSIWYPLSISRYFEKALRHHPGIDLKTTGPYTAEWIPWMGGMNLPLKYAKPPDLPLPFPPNVGKVNYEFVQAQLGDWRPDLVISIDAGITWAYKPQYGYSVTIATDPHVLSGWYEQGARKVSEKFFNMQKCYSEPKDVYLPYAFSAYDHYKIDSYFPEYQEQDHDAVLIGMPYEQRVQWVDELRKLGVSVIFENSPVFDEYRVLANRASIGLNYSSLNDLNARFFETPAFGLPMVANRVPDAHLFLEEDVDYLAFSTMPEAVEKVLYLKDNPTAALSMARRGYLKIQSETYDNRVQQVLEECSLV